MASPAKPLSLIGVSMIRRGPNSSATDPVGAVVLGHFLAEEEDPFVPPHLLAHRLAKGVPEFEDSLAHPCPSASVTICGMLVPR